MPCEEVRTLFDLRQLASFSTGFLQSITLLIVTFRPSDPPPRAGDIPEFVALFTHVIAKATNLREVRFGSRACTGEFYLGEVDNATQLVITQLRGQPRYEQLEFAFVDPPRVLLEAIIHFRRTTNLLPALTSDNLNMIILAHHGMFCAL
jgi:hypothetical protein